MRGFYYRYTRMLFPGVRIVCKINIFSIVFLDRVTKYCFFEIVYYYWHYGLRLVSLKLNLQWESERCFVVLRHIHYSDVIISTMASQFTGVSIVTQPFAQTQGKHQSSASLAFVRGIQRWPVNSPHKGPVTRKMFPFDDVIMAQHCAVVQRLHWLLINVHNTSSMHIASDDKCLKNGFWWVNPLLIKKFGLKKWSKCLNNLNVIKESYLNFSDDAFSI